MDPFTIPSKVSSSPSTLPRSWTYDVFLSFRGDDTRKNFADHFYISLVHKGIKTFRNDDLLDRRGEDISLKILEALEESRIAIIIFSRNYASSAWCLDELVQILHCRKTKQQMVVPIFYHVDPSDIRDQSGSVGYALDLHEKRLDKDEKVTRWREALREVALLSGRHFSDGYEATFIHEIVEDISAYLNVAAYPFAIDSHVQDTNNHVGVKIEGLKLTLGYPVIEELLQKPLSNIEGTRISIHDMNEEMDEEPHSYRMAPSTAWIYWLVNVGLEISSAMFDQFSSLISNNPQSALISMVLAILAVIISIWELIHRGIKEKVIYRRRLGMFGWFYSRSGNKIFGGVPDMFGLLGGISQWVYSTVQYVCILRGIENPYKLYLWPLIFLLCIGASRLYWNRRRNFKKKLKQ